MIRYLCQITFLCLLVAVWPGGLGHAFTLQLGPLPLAEETTPAATVADLPTPQLFRMALDARGMTIGVLPAAIGFQVAPIELYRHDVPISQPPRSPVVRDAQRTVSSHLRGAEVLLWRHTETMASEQAQ